MQPLKIAIMAMGGEGGGVLADWIVDLAEANGHLAQTTSVPGVARPSRTMPPISSGRPSSMCRSTPGNRSSAG